MHRCASLSIRHNTSIAGNRFLDAREAASRGVPLAVQHNTIIRPQAMPAIAIANPGPVVLLENTVVSRAGISRGAELQLSAPVKGDLAAMGNSFTVQQAIQVKGRFLDLGVKPLPDPSAVSRLPFLPPMPPNAHHPISEVPPGADAAAIQAAIDGTVTLAGKGPVVHLPAGDYAIAQTLTIPAGLDVQLIGDGESSVLHWTGAEGGVVLRLVGPSKALLSDFTISADGKAEGILAENCDQPGARIFTEQVSLHDGNIGLLSRLARGYVELHDFAHAGNKVGVKVDAGNPPAGAASATRGHVAIFGGVSGNNALGYELSNGASLLVQDLWNSGGGSMAKLADAGNVTFNGGNLSASSDDGKANAKTPPAPGIVLDNFQGNAAFLGTPCTTHVLVQGDGKQTNLLLLGLQAADAHLLSNTAKQAQVALLDSRCDATDDKQPSTALPDQGNHDPLWLRKMLQHVNLLYPRPLGHLPAELTELSLYRVHIENYTTGLELKGN